MTKAEVNGQYETHQKGCRACQRVDRKRRSDSRIVRCDEGRRILRQLRLVIDSAREGRKQGSPSAIAFGRKT